MEQKFDFGSLATTQATSNIQQRLKPWGIYDVKFSGARKKKTNRNMEDLEKKQLKAEKTLMPLMIF